MRSDMVSFDRSGPAEVPATSQIQVIGTLSADMALTNMLLIVVSAQLRRLGVVDVVIRLT